jgi:hypothetical protein
MIAASLETRLTRAMAYMQAVFDQFYIAILVAGLVGAYIARKNSD